MTIRQGGAIGIKLIGVYFAASGLVGIAGLLASFGVPRMEGLPSARAMLAANALPVIAVMGVAAACLVGGDRLASRFFEDEDTGLDALSLRDLLELGLVLLGMSTALRGVPALLQFAGKALWYAEGSRQSLFAATMEGSWEPLVHAVLELVVGGGLAVSAKRLASVLNATRW